MSHPLPHVIVVGGGFAGLWAALAAAREFALAGRAVKVTVISRDEYLTVRPRLYEAFCTELRAPLAPSFVPLGIGLAVGEVTAIDTATRRVNFVDGDGNTHGAHYDRLVLAAGSRQRPLAVPGAADHAFDVDTFAGAARLDAQLAAVVHSSSPGADCIAIVGAGFTGIELATEMRRRLRVHGGAAAATGARVVLVDRAPVVGPELGEGPRPHLEAALGAARVETRLGVTVTGIDAGGLTLADGERIAAATVILANGLVASPLTALPGTTRDADGRLAVDDSLRVQGAPEVFAAGDVARARADDAHAILMSCQHAVPTGKYAGHNAACDLLGLPTASFSQPAYVTCLDLGDYGALFTSGWERTPQQWGPEVAPLKRKINTRWIYPPTGDREALLRAAALDAPWPPAD
jgi:NADH dehydrogenase